MYYIGNVLKKKSSFKYSLALCQTKLGLVNTDNTNIYPTF